MGIKLFNYCKLLRSETRGRPGVKESDGSLCVGARL